MEMKSKPVETTNSEQQEESLAERATVSDGEYPVVVASIEGNAVGLLCTTASPGILLVPKTSLPADCLEVDAELRVQIEDESVVDVESDVELADPEASFDPSSPPDADDTEGEDGLF